MKAGIFPRGRASIDEGAPADLDPLLLMMVMPMIVITIIRTGPLLVGADHRYHNDGHRDRPFGGRTGITIMTTFPSTHFVGDTALAACRCPCNSGSSVRAESSHLPLIVPSVGDQSARC